MADRGFKSIGHAGIKPLRGRWPRWFFGDNLLNSFQIPTRRARHGVCMNGRVLSAIERE